MKRYICDLETTTHENDCRTWCFALCDIDSLDITLGKTTADLLNILYNLSSPIVYFHNLKFDGNFLVYTLLKSGWEWVPNLKDYKKGKYFSTLISTQGNWYSISFLGKHGKIKIYDSFKIIPLSVASTAKAFKLKESKGSIDYSKYRPIGYEMNRQEEYYVKKDVIIIAKALKYFMDHKLRKITIGSNAMEFYRNQLEEDGLSFDKLFPELTEDEDKFLRYSYKGGWTYCHKKGVFGAGIVLDVNSLYPWTMRNCPMPYGKPLEFAGKYKPNKNYPLYVQCLICNFELKQGHLPMIQIKHNLAFAPTRYLTSSKDENGNEQFVSLVLTSVDLKLFFEQYDVFNIQWEGGYMFKSSTNLFTKYVDYWMCEKIKAEQDHNPGMRQIAKLMLNNLYGKFGSNPNKGSKMPTMENDKVVYHNLEPEYRPSGYLPVAIFTTAWARDKTIRTAQSCYDRFLYSDTDSIHLKGNAAPPNVDIDGVRLGAWKLEGRFLRAKYLRAKTYMELMWDKEKCISTWVVKCAGLPDEAKKQVTLDNFEVGASYKGKLQQRIVSGGVVLKETEFVIRKG